MKGLKVYPENPLLFDFIMDSGKSGMEINSPEFRAESEKLIKYFLASLTIREDDLWVNLSPHEKDRMTTAELGTTELGQDMLAQDYILKQLTASLIYPEKNLGRAFWDKVYEKARARFGSTDIAVDTFNKVWIMADKARVLERNGAAYILDGHLKVMIESDYLAQSASTSNVPLPTRGHDALQADSSQGIVSPGTLPTPQGLNAEAPQVNHLSPAQDLAKQVLKDIIIPEIEKEVNEGANFAPLRQMFHAMILATWYKTALKSALLNQVYSDKGKTAGVLSDDPALKEKIYDQYLTAYKKGVFSYIKEEVSAATQEAIPRKYFSGGIVANFGIRLDRAQAARPQDMIPSGPLAVLTTQIAGRAGPAGLNDPAMAKKRTAAPDPSSQALADVHLEKLRQALERKDYQWTRILSLSLWFTDGSRIIFKSTGELKPYETALPESFSELLKRIAGKIGTTTSIMIYFTPAGYQAYGISAGETDGPKATQRPAPPATPWKERLGTVALDAALREITAKEPLTFPHLFPGRYGIRLMININSSDLGHVDISAATNGGLNLDLVTEQRDTHVFVPLNGKTAIMEDQLLELSWTGTQVTIKKGAASVRKKVSIQRRGFMVVVDQSPHNIIINPDTDQRKNMTVEPGNYTQSTLFNHGDVQILISPAQNMTNKLILQATGRTDQEILANFPDAAMAAPQTVSDAGILLRQGVRHIGSAFEEYRPVFFERPAEHPFRKFADPGPYYTATHRFIDVKGRPDTVLHYLHQQTASASNYDQWQKSVRRLPTAENDFQPYTALEDLKEIKAFQLHDGGAWFLAGFYGTTSTPQITVINLQTMQELAHFNNPHDVFEEHAVIRVSGEQGTVEFFGAENNPDTVRDHPRHKVTVRLADDKAMVPDSIVIKDRRKRPDITRDNATGNVTEPPDANRQADVAVLSAFLQRIGTDPARAAQILDFARDRVRGDISRFIATLAASEQQDNFKSDDLKSFIDFINEPLLFRVLRSGDPKGINRLASFYAWLSSALENDSQVMMTLEDPSARNMAAALSDGGPARAYAFLEQEALLGPEITREVLLRDPVLMIRMLSSLDRTLSFDDFEDMYRWAIRSMESKEGRPLADNELAALKSIMARQFLEQAQNTPSYKFRTAFEKLQQAGLSRQALRVMFWEDPLWFMEGLLKGDAVDVQTFQARQQPEHIRSFNAFLDSRGFSESMLQEDISSFAGSDRQKTIYQALDLVTGLREQGLPVLKITGHLEKTGRISPSFAGLLRQMEDQHVRRHNAAISRVLWAETPQALTPEDVTAALNEAARTMTSRDYAPYLNGKGLALRDEVSRLAQGSAAARPAMTGQSLGKLQALLSRVPTIARPNTDLFVDVLNALPPEVLKIMRRIRTLDKDEITGEELVEIWYDVQLTNNCPNNCLQCAFAVHPGKVTHMPYPVAVKLLQALQALTPEARFFLYNDTEPLAYHDRVTGANLADLARAAPLRLNEGVTHGVNMFHGTDDDLKFLFDAQVLTTISFHMLHDKRFVQLARDIAGQDLSEDDMRGRLKAARLDEAFLRRFAPLNAAKAASASRDIDVRFYRINYNNGRGVEAVPRGERGTPLLLFFRAIDALQGILWKDFIAMTQAREGENVARRLNAATDNPQTSIVFIGNGANILRDEGGFSDDEIRAIQAKRRSATILKTPRILQVRPDGTLQLVVDEWGNNPRHFRTPGEISASGTSPEFGRAAAFLKMAAAATPGPAGVSVAWKDVPLSLHHAADRTAPTSGADAVITINGTFDYWDVLNTIYLDAAVPARGSLRDMINTTRLDDPSAMEQLYQHVSHIPVPDQFSLSSVDTALFNGELAQPRMFHNYSTFDTPWRAFTPRQGAPDVHELQPAGHDDAMPAKEEKGLVKGGIDLNMKEWRLHIRQTEDSPALSSNNLKLELIEQAAGVTPVIISILALDNLPLFMGIDSTALNVSSP
jgi:hypothetical protein